MAVMADLLFKPGSERNNNIFSLAKQVMRPRCHTVGLLVERPLAFPRPIQDS
jgi:hypothetical protein